MSQVRIDYSDRAVSNSTGNEKLRYMIRSGGFVMAKVVKSRAKPLVFTEKEWAKIPLWEPEV